jgi:hypothetical protein
MGFVYLAAFFISESLLAQIGNSPVNIKVESGKIVQLAGELKNLGSHRVSYFERLRIGILT